MGLKREIIFCGFCKDLKEWVYGDFAHANQFSQPVIIMQTGNFFVDPESVGQYTGAKDANEKPIFEGDEMTSPEGNKGFVEFSQQLLSFIVHTEIETFESVLNSSITSFWHC